MFRLGKSTFGAILRKYIAVGKSKSLALMKLDVNIKHKILNNKH